MIVDLKIKGKDKHLMQIPVGCTFNIRRTGNIFFILTIHMRAYFEAKKTDDDSLYVSLFEITPYHLGYSEYVNPLEASSLFFLAEQLAIQLEGDYMLPGIPTPFFRPKTDYQLIDFRTHKEDVCFWFKEK